MFYSLLLSLPASADGVSWLGICYIDECLSLEQQSTQKECKLRLVTAARVTFTSHLSMLNNRLYSKYTKLGIYGIYGNYDYDFYDYDFW